MQKSTGSSAAKQFSVLSIERRITLYDSLTRDKHQCFKSIFGFVAVVITFVIVIIVHGYCGFGTQVKEFFTVHDCILSALKILISYFDVNTFNPFNKAFTFFFLLSTRGMNLVLLSMLVIIVFHGYFFVKIRKIRVKRKSGGVFKQMGLKKLATWWQDNNKNKNEDARRNKLLGDQINHQNLHQMLLRTGMTDSEVKDLLENHNIHNIEPTKFVNAEAARQIFEAALQQIDDETDDESEPSDTYVMETAIDESTEMEWTDKKIKLIQTSLNEINRVCDVIKGRLDAIRVPSSSV